MSMNLVLLFFMSLIPLATGFLEHPNEAAPFHPTP
jgi:hypothetical protein